MWRLITIAFAKAPSSTNSSTAAKLSVFADGAHLVMDVDCRLYNGERPPTGVGTDSRCPWR